MQLDTTSLSGDVGNRTLESCFSVRHLNHLGFIPGQTYDYSVGVEFAFAAIALTMASASKTSTT
jgi:hypothetical protein